MLIDILKEIAITCNKQNIVEVKCLSISHSDPDHVKGMRIVEKIGYDFTQEKNMSIRSYVLSEAIGDTNRVDGDRLKYYRDILQCTFVRGASHIKIDNIDINLINNNPGRNTTSCIIRERFKKVIYAYCNPKLFMYNELYFSTETVIIGLASDDDILGDGTAPKEAPSKDEIWGKPYGYCNELEKLW